MRWVPHDSVSVLRMETGVILRGVLASALSITSLVICKGSGLEAPLGAKQTADASCEKGVRCSPIRTKPSAQHDGFVDAWNHLRRGSDA